MTDLALTLRKEQFGKNLQTPRREDGWYHLWLEDYFFPEKDQFIRYTPFDKDFFKFSLLFLQKNARPRSRKLGIPRA